MHVYITTLCFTPNLDPVLQTSLYKEKMCGVAGNT
jgi:hypothetical protein